jgi:hypothetical protein
MTPASAKQLYRALSTTEQEYAHVLFADSEEVVGRFHETMTAAIIKHTDPFLKLPSTTNPKVRILEVTVDQMKLEAADAVRVIGAPDSTHYTFKEQAYASLQLHYGSVNKQFVEAAIDDADPRTHDESDIKSYVGNRKMFPIGKCDQCGLDDIKVWCASRSMVSNISYCHRCWRTHMAKHHHETVYEQVNKKQKCDNVHGLSKH